MLISSRTLAPALTAALAAALAVPLVAATTTEADAAAGPRTCHGLRATIVGTAGKDRLVGTPRRDVIVGLAGDDKIDGRGGNDVICGGDGADVLLGGPGDDRVESGRQDRATTRDGTIGHPDEVAGGPGDDVLVLDADDRPLTEGSTAFSRITYKHSRTGVRVSLGDGARGTARGEGRDTLVTHEAVMLVGSAHDDRITGSPGADWVFGGTGSDVVAGLGGDDVLTGDPLVLTGSSSRDDDDQVDGGEGDDDLRSQAGADVLHGGAGADTLGGYSDRAAQLLGDDGDDSLSTYLVEGFALDGGLGADTATLFRDPDQAPPSSDPVVVHTASGRITQGGLTGRGTGVETYRAEYGLTLQTDPTS